MRALPQTSFIRRSTCARITCEPARKLPRRHYRANAPSAANLESPRYYEEARACSRTKLVELHLAKSFNAPALDRPRPVSEITARVACELHSAVGPGASELPLGPHLTQVALWRVSARS